MRLRLIGIGGTGVVTVSQILGVAALIDGRHASGLDQTGLSQKAGPVVSDIRLTAAEPVGGVTPSSGAADVVLAFDVIGVATARNLSVADRKRTVAIVSTSGVPTGRMVLNSRDEKPDVGAATKAINALTRSCDNVFLDAQGMSQALFGDHLPANMIALGAAWQRGAVPLSHEALSKAIQLNGASVDKNEAAFEWGRFATFDPQAVDQLLRPPANADSPPPRVSELVARFTQCTGELRRLLRVRAMTSGAGGVGERRHATSSVLRMWRYGNRNASRAARRSQRRSREDCTS